MMTMKIAGKMQSSSGKEDLDRDLLRLFLGQLPADEPHVVGLLAQHAPDGDAEPVGLDERGDEVLDLWSGVALAEGR